MNKIYDPNFDAAKVKDEVVAWIRDFFEKNGPGCNAVVAISGGKDSSVAAALCVEALGKDRVFGVLLPNGEQKDINASYTIYDLLNRQKEAGVAVVYVGEDLDVLLALSDRILVLCEGHVNGILDARTTDKNEVGMRMTSMTEKGGQRDEQ